MSAISLFTLPTPERLQQLRDFIAGGSCPRETVTMESKELRVLIDLADAQIRGATNIGLNRKGTPKP